jgi:hypothetical protein
MGMHWGLVAATTSMDVFLDELTRHAGEFTRGEAVGSVSSWDRDEDAEGFVLAVGERDGRTYLLDTSFMLSDMPDALVAMSERLGMVVGGGAETVSGTWWLTVARDGELLRFVFVQHASMTKGMAIGDPLPTETVHPIVHLGGAGLFAVLDHFGFDWQAWVSQGPAFALSYDVSRMPADGRVAQLRDEHMARYAHPPEYKWTDHIGIVVRSGRSGGAGTPVRGLLEGGRRWWRRARRTEP